MRSFILALLVAACGGDDYVDSMVVGPDAGTDAAEDDPFADCVELERSYTLEASFFFPDGDCETTPVNWELNERVYIYGNGDIEFRDRPAAQGHVSTASCTIEITETFGDSTAEAARLQEREPGEFRGTATWTDATVPEWPCTETSSRAASAVWLQ